MGSQQGKIVRLLPGVYAAPIEVGTPNVTPLQIVATGATLTSFTGVLVTNGANVAIRGLESSGANFALRCGQANMARAKLSYSDGALFAGTSSANLAAIGNCDARMSNVRFAINDSTGNSLSMSTDGAFDGDRLHFYGQQDSGIGMFGVRMSVRITNSVLENLLTSFASSDQSPGTTLTFAFNTIVLRQFALGCTANSGSAYRTILFENNIVVGPTLAAVIDGTTCAFSNNILLPQPSAPPGNLVADPQFIDAPMRNYRVNSGSPAVGAALSAPMIFTDHDHDGRPRPTGTAADIGAFEQ